MRRLTSYWGSGWPGPGWPPIPGAFRLTSLHPGPGVDRYADAALTGATIDQATRMLGTLARACLIQPAGQGRYGVHDRVRGYARELAADQADLGRARQASHVPGKAGVCLPDLCRPVFLGTAQGTSPSGPLVKQVRPGLSGVTFC
jgi:hypothetical protein